jgi:sulfopyruvate decarboxylase subunit alpha
MHHAGQFVQYELLPFLIVQGYQGLPGRRVTTGRMGASAEAVHAGLIAAGIEFCIYLPDSGTGALTALIEADERITTIVCAREDEGIAIASGLFVAGKRAVVIMECSGLGYAGLILARCRLQRTPVFILTSHGGTIGEPFDYHIAPIAAARAIVDGLHLDSIVLRPGDPHRQTIRLAFQTVENHRTTMVVFMPLYLDDFPAYEGAAGAAR